MNCFLFVYEKKFVRKRREREEVSFFQSAKKMKTKKTFNVGSFFRNQVEVKNKSEKKETLTFNAIVLNMLLDETILETK